MRKLRLFFLPLEIALIATIWHYAGVSASEPFVPGSPIDDVPSGWNSSNHDEITNDEKLGEILNIIGDGKSSNWLSGKIPFESRRAYRLRFIARGSDLGGSGCFCMGTNFFNVDDNLGGDSETFEKKSVVFFTPDGTDGRYDGSVRFAQWESRNKFQVAQPRLCAVLPVCKQITASQESSDGSCSFLELGAGEKIDENGNYSFAALKSQEATNYDRPIFSTTTFFNSNRFCFSKGQDLVYHFVFEPSSLKKSGKKTIVSNLDPIPFNDGSISINVNYFVRGKVTVSASLNNEDWIQIGEISEPTTKEFPLATFFEGKERSELFIRIAGEESVENEGCSLQVNRIGVNLRLAQKEGIQFQGIGETIFADLSNEEKSSEPEALPWVFNEDGCWTVPDANHRSVLIGWGSKRLPEEKVANDAGSYASRRLYTLNVKREAKLERIVWQYFVQDYTSLIADARSSEGVDLSWCEADYHIPKNPLVCEIQKARPIILYSAGNDYESFQIALRPQTAKLVGLNAFIEEDLEGDGASISKENVQLRRAYYHYVSDPTDRTCAPGYYPDALIPLDKGADGLGAPLDVEQFDNLPVWVTVKTPSGTKPGLYKGTVKLTANNGAFAASVPFAVRVWNFELPVKNTHETAFGFSPHTVWLYHNCQTDADKRAVLEMYLKMFGDYRISPYNPVPMDSIKYKWRPDTNPPSCEVDFTDFDKEIKRVFDKYHFTNFKLSFNGLGGGTYDSRYEGEAGGFAAGTPEYESMMTDYGEKVQEHLRETGMLTAAYTYTFDEPEPKDYEFVANEFAKIKKYMPDVSRMLTEEPSPDFERILNEHGTSVNIWCPISNAFSQKASENQRKEGARFWWYVCTGPKEPYCTEFTDHAAQELRIWHWQAFERDIVGSLIWESVYWTSETAFGENYQNPYEDPMCYMTGYGSPKGTKSPWGNGDGRFIYPPITAAVPGMNGGKPVLDAPNASVRWEMLRAGIQDVETLRILEDLLKAKGDALSADKREEFEKLFDFSAITTDMTHFSSDPQVLLERRRAVGEAIEELLR